MDLPYGLSELAIISAVRRTEDYFVNLNDAATSFGGPKLTDVVSASALSSIVSDSIISSITIECSELIRNRLHGGFPDLLPKALYRSDGILRGSEGIEVKSSKKSAWQGHNPENGLVMAVKYSLQTSHKPLLIEKVLLAKLITDDWTMCPRKYNSRRTPTASINKSGLIKLRSNVIYNGV